LDNAASNTRSFTEFDKSYQPPSGAADPNTVLVGTRNFTPSEIEVFHIV
jgi:hypothetical protein